MIQELESVALTVDLPEHNLKKDDLGTVVLTHPEGCGFEVEFLTLEGETLAVISLHPNEVRAITRNEIAHARRFVGLRE